MVLHWWFSPTDIISSEFNVIKFIVNINLAKMKNSKIIFDKHIRLKIILSLFISMFIGSFIFLVKKILLAI